MPFEISSSKDILALVDCNNFFASCERVFDPTLNGKPVVVLSNNDGCAIARSNEAKALGIKMGQPRFEWDWMVKARGVRVFSTNFALYGDISARVMKTLEQFTPDIEVYSIDEAFLGLTGQRMDDVEALGQKIRRTVFKQTGMPVSVGIATTKTLAKLANHVAKKQPKQQGVCSLLDSDQADCFMRDMPVEEVWGIGTRKAKWLKDRGIQNVYDLKMSDDQFIKKNLSVVTLRTVYELRGIACMELLDVVPDKKSIATTRTFAKEIHDRRALQKALLTYVARAAEKMRAQGSAAGNIQIFLATSPFRPDYYANSASGQMDPATDYTPDLMHVAQKLLNQIYRPGLGYKRAGVVLSDFVTGNANTVELFNDTDKAERKRRLMDVVDRLNAANSGGGVFFAGEGVGALGSTKQEHRSRRKTSQWDELLPVG